MLILLVWVSSVGKIEYSIDRRIWVLDESMFWVFEQSRYNQDGAL